MKPKLNLVESDTDRELGKDRGRIEEKIKIALQRVKNESMKEEATESRVNEKIKAGRYYKPKKPFTVPESKVQNLKNFYNTIPKSAYPVLLEAKYDGVAVEIHKDGEDIEVLSDDGGDLTDQLPKIVNQIKELDGDLVLGAELELWMDGSHYPRAECNGVIHDEDTKDDDIVANLFDCLYLNGDIHLKGQEKRREMMKEHIGDKAQKTAKEPDKDKLNISPAIKCKDLGQLKESVPEYWDNKSKEGVIAKKADAPYELQSEKEIFWKLHRVVVVEGIVLSKDETKTPGVYNYEWGVENDLDTPLMEGEKKEVDNTVYAKCGKTFSTDLELNEEDTIYVENETMTLYLKDGEYRISGYAPRIMNEIGEFARRKFCESIK